MKKTLKEFTSGKFRCGDVYACPAVYKSNMQTYVIGAEAVLALSSSETRYYVSYAWNDDTPGGPDREKFVDDLCAKAEKQGIPIFRDKTAMKYGDSISKFMQPIGQGDRIFIVLSEKYLKSAYCMQELFNVWRNCCEDEAKFVARTRVFVLPCAKIKTMKQRTERAKYWRKALQNMEKVAKGCHVLDMSNKDIADYRSMSDFANKTADILYLVQDVLRPRTFDEFVKYGFGAPPPP